MVNRTTLDHRQDRIAIPFGVTEPLERHHPTAFAPAITISRGVKGFTAPVRRDRLQLRQGDVGKGRKHQLDPAGQRQVTFTIAQALAGQMQRNQRGRAGSINRHGRPLQAEGIGEPPRGNTMAAAGGGVGIQLGQALHAGQRAIVTSADAYKDTSRAINERARRDSSPLQCFPTDL